ncbi:MAG: hypothetical protein JOZ12_11240, partial [Sinobacteraceae bacterium]|nr:hypothetical protein [Nevskiaceae bacterium]
MVVLMALVVARDPASWFASMTPQPHSTAARPVQNVPAAHRETVVGGNQPAPPREPPESELLNAQALNAAAEYAQSHRSL